jgi:TolB-like protein
VDPAIGLVTGPDGASESAAPGRRRPLLLAALAALLLIGAWALVDRRSVQDDASATPRAKSVAVLPFLPLAEEHREPALEIGMADTLIGRLSGIRQLVVRPIALVRRYNRPDRDPLQVGQDLGVDAVVEGSLQRSGEVLRVNVRLLRVADGAALWAGSFDEEFSNIFAVQDSMCSRIAEALALQLGPEELQGLGRGGTANAAAYEAYLKGRFHFSRLTPAEMQASIDYFGEAVAIDPAYAQAWARPATLRRQYLRDGPASVLPGQSGPPGRGRNGAR